MHEMEEFKEELKLNSSTLEEEAQKIVQTSGLLTDNLAKANKIVWRMLGFIWAVMICLLIAYVAFLPKSIFDSKSDTYKHQASNATPAKQNNLPESSPVSSPPSAPAEFFPHLLNRIREAQLQKDIDLFLSAYSPSFPKITKKREQTLRIWKTYDFLEIKFLIHDLQQKDAQTFLAKVTWIIKAQNLYSNEIQKSLKTYQVAFSKGSGKWLIQDLETLDE